MNKLTDTIEKITIKLFYWVISTFMIAGFLYLPFRNSLVIKFNGCLFLGFTISTLVFFIIFLVKMIQKFMKIHYKRD